MMILLNIRLKMYRLAEPKPLKNKKNNLKRLDEKQFFKDHKAEIEKNKVLKYIYRKELLDGSNG